MAAARRQRGPGPCDTDQGQRFLKTLKNAIEQQVYYTATHPEASLATLDKTRAAIAALFALEVVIEFEFETYTDVIAVLNRLLGNAGWLAQWRDEDAVMDDIARFRDKAEREQDRRMAGRPERELPTAWDRIRD